MYVILLFGLIPYIFNFDSSKIISDLKSKILLL